MGKQLTETQKQHKREYNLARYHAIKNSPKEKTRRKTYYNQNKDDILEKSKDYYQDNLEHGRMKRKQWKLKRKEKSKTDVDQTFRELLSNVKSRSKKIGRECNIDLDYLHKLWNKQQGLCKLSKLPMSSAIGSKGTKVSPDRINSKLGYVKGNIQLVRAAVNTFKLDMTQREFIKLCKAIAENN